MVVKKKSLWKDIFRDIKGSLGRFIAIVAIIALGVAFFTGLKIAPQNMKQTADQYYDDYNFMDLEVLSTLGLTDDDVDAIENLEGVEQAKGAYSLDVIAEDGEREIAIRIHDFAQEDQVNAPRLIEGKLPTKENECVVEIDNQNELDVKIGDTLKLFSGKKDDLADDLKNTEFEVVGFIQSPYYISFEKGTTDVGSGQIRDFIMIPQENFKSDVFTQLYVNVLDTKPFNSYEDDYFDVVNPVEKRIEDIAEQREDIRYEEIYNEAKEELDEGRAEYEKEKEKAEAELTKAKQEIEDARKEIIDGEQKLAENEEEFNTTIADAENELAKADKQLTDGESEYQKGLAEYNTEKKKAEQEFKAAESELEKAEDGINTLKINIDKIESALNNPQIPQETLNELKVQLKELRTTLANTEDEYKQGQVALDESKQEFKQGQEQAQAEFSQAEADLIQAEADITSLKDNISQIEVSLNNPDLPEEQQTELQTQLDQLESTLTQAEDEYEAGKASLKQSKEEFKLQEEQAQTEFQNAEAELKQAEDGMSTLKENIAKIESTINNPQIPEQEEAELRTQLNELRTTLTNTQNQYEAGKKDLADGRQRLTSAKQELDASKKQLDDAKNQLEAEKDKLATEKQKGLDELQAAQTDLEEAKAELADGEQEYQDAKAEADEELAEALKEIEEGEAELDDLDEAEWYVLNREKHYSYVDYGDAAERIDALAKVFPTFFTLVAALVTLTTMTRMVDEQRVNIGTLKALGYPRSDIVNKYIVYSLAATILGIIIGIAIGYTVFPIIIFNAYAIMYAIPPVILSFDFKLVLIVSLVAILLTTLTSFLASNNQLKENPSALMRPKAPRLGKSVFLERIPFIWNRFNFNYKVTIRNLFRYKRRFFMTVFGIAGCTALILAGFGIKDSIQTVVDKQFGEVFSYDMDVGIENDAVTILNNEETIQDYHLVHTEGATLTFEEEDKDITITVPEDVDEFDQFIKLQNRKSGDSLDLHDGLILTEGMSRELDIKQGDTIELTNSDDEVVKVEVASIAENYTFNYIYLSKDQYKAIFDQPLEYNRALSILQEDPPINETELSNKLLSQNDITSISFTSTSQDDLVDTINSLNYVVILMTVSAGALAFVVLYNLTNINISERIREIATIKVLGFYNKEVSAYIYRENVIITLIGILTGLGIGIFLHKYIITTVEMESLMLGLSLYKLSYLYAGLLTAAFALIVNVVMHYKLKNIEMVESLKSVD